MRVLLLGPTGRLGRRVIPALINHKHTVVLYVRNIPKLQSLASPSLLELVHAIVEGDATDSAGIKKALVDYDIEAIIDVAGDQVPPWQEYVLPKIASAVTAAAISVGKERGAPLRVWITGNVALLQYPGTPYLIHQYIFDLATAQPQATAAVVASIPLSQMEWSILAIGRMQPMKTPQGPFQIEDVKSPHGLLVKAGSPPGWQSSWIESIPIIGRVLWFLYIMFTIYGTKYEAVADFLAEDLGKEESEWIGKAVGVKAGRERKDV